MVRPLHPQLLAYLVDLQRAAPVTEGHSVGRPHERTVRRWYRDLGERLIAFPTFALDRLGLMHLHVFLKNAPDEWLRFPYAVEHAWMTNDFAGRVLYLHCVVPTVHQTPVQELLRELAGSGVEILSTGDGDQDLPLLGGGTTRTPVLSATSVLLQEVPLVVPVIFEGWNQRASMPRLWAAVHDRLGGRVRDYVRCRVRRTNGKMHVKHAYEQLTSTGLFRQQVIRYAAFLEDAVEILVVLPDAQSLDVLRPHSRSIEQYEGEHLVVRLVGTNGLFNALLSLPPGSARLYFVHRQPTNTARVRFCYEFLFDPKPGAWVFCRERVLTHLQGAT
jgi:hypothetical protein